MNEKTFEPGVYFDSNRGIHMGKMIQEMAVEHGWEGEPVNLDDEFYWEATQEAEDFLNELAPEGYYFGPSEQGDWGLWEIEE
jgi:hypothetical protein